MTNIKPHEPTQEELNYLGFRLTAMDSQADASTNEPLDIENILFKICVYLQEGKFDGRLASVLMSWMKVHGEKVFVDRLRKYRELFVHEHQKDVHWLRFLAYYNLSLKRHNWKPLTKSIKTSERAHDFYLGDDKLLAKPLLKRWGLESFLPPNSGLKVHKGALRVREEDVLEPAALLMRNKQYTNRFRFGANVRSDTVTHMESGKFTSTAALSRFLGLSRQAVAKNWEDYQFSIQAAENH